MESQRILELIIYQSQLSLIDSIVEKYGYDNDIRRDILIQNFLINSKITIDKDNIMTKRKRGRPKKPENTKSTVISSKST